MTALSTRWSTTRSAVHRPPAARVFTLSGIGRSENSDRAAASLLERSRFDLGMANHAGLRGSLPVLLSNLELESTDSWISAAAAATLSFSPTFPPGRPRCLQSTGRVLQRKFGAPARSRARPAQPSGRRWPNRAWQTSERPPARENRASPLIGSPITRAHPLPRHILKLLVGILADASGGPLVTSASQALVFELVQNVHTGTSCRNSHRPFPRSERPERAC